MSMMEERIGRSPSQRTRVLCRQVDAALAVGRHDDALLAIRRTRRLHGICRWKLALAETDALLGLARYREAADVAARALRGQSGADDATTRLRLVRGQALWLAGQVASGRAAVRKAAGQAQAPLTRARAHELLGHMACGAFDLDEAHKHAEAAHDLYVEGDHVKGIVRVLATQAATLRGRGRLHEALALLDRRIELAATSVRLDAQALAHHDRGVLLAVMGRWREARTEVERSRHVFGLLRDPREHTLAGVSSAGLDLAAGNLDAARRALESAQRSIEDGGEDVRGQAEIWLATSDLALAQGDPHVSDEHAIRALGLFAALGDKPGESRCRVRRGHALLALGRTPEAVVEARRAVRGAVRGRPELAALAALTLGRVLLREHPEHAVAAFDDVLRLGMERPGFVAAARLGRVLARGEMSASESALETLREWGDRRLVAYALADMAALCGAPPPAADALLMPRSEQPAPALTVLAAAGVALATPGASRERWGRALRELRQVVAWQRAVHVGEPGLAWSRDNDDARPLTSDDLAVLLARDCRSPACYALASSGAGYDHPQVHLHGLRYALVVPLANGNHLYLDFGAGASAPDAGVLHLVAEFGRLFEMCSGEGEGSIRETPRFAGILGRCPAMLGLFDEMRKVAASEIAVHVYGETGTGKERIAKALHEHSRRARSPFVAVNASSLSDELFEAELFGHTKGAFTGAVTAREGFLAAAEGGTLFIDEVTDLSPRAQAKLLRFLQEHEYRRLGESQLRRADVRIVSAANRDLAECVAAGVFREDLMYRLNPVVLRLPPLRERGEDVLLLARHFLREAAREHGRTGLVLPAEVRRQLQRCAWPGNIRQLENEMSRLVALAGEGPIAAEHVSAPVRCASEHGRKQTLRLAREAFEKDLVRTTLAGRGGNRTRTAAALGITRQALLDKLKRYGL